MMEYCVSKNKYKHRYIVIFKKDNSVKYKYKYLVNCGVLCVQTWGFNWLHRDLKQKYQNLLDHSTIVYNCT